MKVIGDIVRGFAFSFFTTGSLVATILLFKEVIVLQGLKACAMMLLCGVFFAIFSVFAWCIGCSLRGDEE